jgi:tetratricopeptide (TPR) repeat protein/predicted Ser/Thr protein kinase
MGGTVVDKARAYRLFSEALELEPKDRDAFLADRCCADPALRADVDELLQIAAEDRAITAAFLAPPAPPESLAGNIVGRYRLEELIGEGGMGVVYRAVRTDEVRQSVAIKLMTSIVTEAAQKSFEREAQILARLEHPSIGRLIDAGIKDNRPWIVLEFVRGIRVDEHCAAQALGTRAIVALLVSITEAVAEAHRMLVVHSDIKPSNVLVGVDGKPKLIDFGISTALREANADVAATVGVRGLFSPGYAAPERVNRGPITVATDVFGLGALAYRLLTGVPVHDGPGGALGYLLAVTQRDVALPSRAALEAGNESRARQLRGDLDAILLKALEREPQLRYASAGDLRADLQRYLDRRPVAARPPSLGYRTAKFLRRNRAASLLGGIAILAVLFAAVGFAWQNHLLAQQRDAARIAAARAQRVTGFLVSMLQAANPHLGGQRDVTVAEVLDAGAAQARTGLADDPLIRAQILTAIAETDYELGRYAQGLASANDAVELLAKRPTALLDMAMAQLIKGRLLSDSGDRPAAEKALRAALEQLDTLPGTDLQQAVTLKELGVVLSRNNDPEVVEPFYRRAIAIFQRLGVDDAEHGDTLIYLGELLQREGRYAESLRIEQQGEAMMLRHEEPDNPYVLGAGIAIAEALQSLGRYAEAETIHRRVLATRERVLGPRHLDTLVSRLSLAANLRMQHRYGDSISLAQSATENFSPLVPTDHPTRVFALSVLGLAQCLGAEAARGLMALQEADRIRAEHFPSADRRRSLGRVLIAVCLGRIGRREEAAQIFGAESAWRALANGSFADLPQLVEERFPSTPPP